MRIAILAHGTRGDIQPALVIGERLRQSGHAVTLAVNSDLAEWAGRSGVTVRPSALDVTGFLNTAEAQAFLANGRFATLVRRITADECRVNDSIVDACIDAADNADLILATISMAYRGECLAQARQIPSRPLFCYPFHTTGQWASLLSGGRDLRLRSANRASFGAFHAMLWRRSRANIDDMCRTLRIPRFRRRPRIEDRPSLNAYSPVLAPPPPDWNARTEVVGTVAVPPSLRTRLGEAGIPADLAAWLEAGPAPVYFGFGSMPVQRPERLLADVADLTARRGLRALIGTGATDYGVPARDVSGHVYLAGSVLDHDEVLPRCRAAVHHGGCGTTMAALRAGIPSVVASVFFDQPFWGWRVQQAKIGVTLPYRRLTAQRLAEALDRVLGEEYRDRAAALRVLTENEDGAGRSVEVIESWASNHRYREEPEHDRGAGNRGNSAADDRGMEQR